MVLKRPILSEMYPENERPNAEPLTSKISEGRRGGGGSLQQKGLTYAFKIAMILKLVWLLKPC
jgi:hypothetical protein